MNNPEPTLNPNLASAPEPAPGATYSLADTPSASNPASLTEPSLAAPNLSPSPSQEADKSLAQAYQAAADFMKQLDLEG